MDVIPGRMGLLVTLFLVLVNIFNTVTTNTPKAEGLTAIEAWMLSCILFVFGALVGEEGQSRCLKTKLYDFRVRHYSDEETVGGNQTS